MLLSAVLGLALSCVSTLASRTQPDELPVYMFNAHSNAMSNSVLSHDALPALVSHFLGDGRESLSEENEAVLRYIPSRFLEEDHAAVVTVDNFDTVLAERKLGSPAFYVGEQSIDKLNGRSSKTSVGRLGKAIFAKDDNVIGVNAFQDNTDYNDKIIEDIGALNAVKVMLIGIPSSKSSRNAADASAASKFSISKVLGIRNSSDLEYARIPEFFDTEESCVSLTKDCANHGSCVKSSNGRYTCKCKATTTDSYTYYWGGNDCSKRDVSFQFNLIVGTTIAIVAVSVLSISLLFNLGSEPLPGVLNTSTL